MLNSAPSVVHSTRTVALTFDDGPGQSTQAIINVLRTYRIRATFFNIGLGTARNPSLVREEVADGFLVGDHTNSHPVMAGLTANAQINEIVQAGTRQRDLTRTAPCVFRPPYGIYNAATIRIARRHGMSFWMWSDGGGDWQASGSASGTWIRYIERSVIDISKRQRHPVVLLHDQRRPMPATVAALPTIIRSFKRRGYVFVDLLGRTGPPGTCGNPAARGPSPSYTTLSNGAVLRPGEAKTSPNDQFALSMESNGQLDYHEIGGPKVWASPTAGNPGASASLSGGVLSVTAVDGSTLWSVGTSALDATLHLESNGGLALVQGTTPLWSSHTSLTTMHAGESLLPGWYISSPNGRCRLAMTTFGELTLTSADHQVLWRNGTRTPDGRTILLNSGNLATASGSGKIVWSSSAPAHRNILLSVTDRGTLMLATPSGYTTWATQ